MKATHRIENAADTSPEGPRAWIPFHVELPLTRTQAFELCQVLASAPGAQTVWRVVSPEGIQLLLIAGGVRS